MQIQLIPIEDIKRVWSLKWAAVTAALAAIPVAYMTMPSDWTAVIPDWIKLALAVATLVTAAGTGVARVIKQPT